MAGQFIETSRSSFVAAPTDMHVPTDPLRYLWHNILLRRLRRVHPLSGVTRESLEYVRTAGIIFKTIPLLTPVSMLLDAVLTPEERSHAVDRMARDVRLYTKEAADGRKVGWAAWKFALTDWQKLVILAGQICIVMPVVAFLIFTPIVVGGMGFAGVKANLVSQQQALRSDICLHVELTFGHSIRCRSRLSWWAPQG